MKYAEVLDRARARMAPNCKVCPVCDGRGCRSTPAGGPGGGQGFIRNYDRLHQIRIHMDTIYDHKEQDTSLPLFGRTFAAPVFAAPIANVGRSYSSALTEEEYARAVILGCAAAGCAAFTGDGLKEEFFTLPLPYITQAGTGIPTLKPMSPEITLPKLRRAEEAGADAVAMDIDAVAFQPLLEFGRGVMPRGVEALREIISATRLPFLLKGIMTPQGAEKAARAGAYGIVVSNHGGRSLADAMATCDVLPGIRRAVGGDLKILVDGGFRTGADIFKARALGADAVLIGRPYSAAAYGGGAEGVELLTRRLREQLAETMTLAGCATLEEITSDKIAWER